MSLKFGQIRPRTTELAALKRLKNLIFPFFLALYSGSQVSIVALWATCFFKLNKYRSTESVDQVSSLFLIKMFLKISHQHKKS